MRILFVCNANIVRSFMAERILQTQLERHGQEARAAVSSAGLLDMEGALADAKARRVLRENGIRDEGHRPRLLKEELVEEADLIVTMEREQLRKIQEQYPQAAGKAMLLTGCMPERERGNAAGDIGDPHRRSLFHYRLCFAEIFLAMEALRKCI